VSRSSFSIGWDRSSAEIQHVLLFARVTRVSNTPGLNFSGLTEPTGPPGRVQNGRLVLFVLRVRILSSSRFSLSQCPLCVSRFPGTCRAVLDLGLVKLVFAELGSAPLGWCRPVGLCRPDPFPGFLIFYVFSLVSFPQPSGSFYRTPREILPHHLPRRTRYSVP